MKKIEKRVWLLVLQNRFTLVNTPYICVVARDLPAAKRHVYQVFDKSLYDVHWCLAVSAHQFLAVTPFVYPNMEDILL